MQLQAVILSVQKIYHRVEHNRMRAREVAEGALVGTWVLDEVRLAVRKDYQLEVYVLYNYNVIQYDPKTVGGLFVM
jgi:hypothetical protein